jgi:putative transposase
MRTKGLAAARVRYGYKRICLLLNREGWHVNHKRVYRLYREEGLGIRTKTPRGRRIARYREGRSEIEAANDVWAMDFVSDRLFNQRPFRILALMDCFSRESLAKEPRGKFLALNVVELLDRAVAERGRPKSIRVDNGSEFAGKLLDQWACHNGVELDFSRPGKPTNNAFIESFNARLRAECLNASWLLSLEDARQRLKEWKEEYNTDRPHSALGNLTPSVFRYQTQQARKIA